MGVHLIHEAVAHGVGIRHGGPDRLRDQAETILGTIRAPAYGEHQENRA